jgi:hypothetical protein
MASNITSNKEQLN